MITIEPRADEGRLYIAYHEGGDTLAADYIYFNELQGLTDEEIEAKTTEMGEKIQQRYELEQEQKAQELLENQQIADRLNNLFN